ncbi:hypothetical protein OG741_00580 [Streptomyces sp. NBC_01410]|uniref:hypothetical protein n=1 Tax=Streptomyces sp. NBC_01410 TaxID=2903856 RepID=UPI0032460ED6
MVSEFVHGRWCAPGLAALDVDELHNASHILGHRGGVGRPGLEGESGEGDGTDRGGGPGANNTANSENLHQPGETNQASQSTRPEE